MKEAIKIITQLLFFYTLTYMAVAAYGDKTQMPVYGIWIFILTLSCFWLRNRGEKTIFFVWGHITIMCAGVFAGWLCPLPGGFALLSILIVICSILVRLFPEIRRMEEPGYFQLVVLALVCFWNNYWGKSQGAQEVSFAAFLITLLLMVLYGNLKEADIFIRNRASSTQMDEDKLKRCNGLFSFLYTCMLFPILMVLSGFQNESISRFFRWLMIMILGLIPKDGKAEYIPKEHDMVVDMIPGEPCLFIKILLMLLKIMAVIVLLTGIAYAVISVIKAIYKRFYRTKSMGDIKEYAEPLTVSEKITRRERKSFFGPFDRSPAQRVRRMYKKSFYPVFRRAGKELQHLSPEEQLAAADITGEQAEELLTLYEKARYSRTEVTGEDVQRMKDLTMGLFFRL